MLNKKMRPPHMVLFPEFWWKLVVNQPIKRVMSTSPIKIPQVAGLD
jgi:hypothetical protein